MGTAEVVGRLAPTPSGRLHLGNVVAFGAAWLSARNAGGRVLLRIEDVDVARARPALVDSIRDDLRWLGLTWDEEVTAQRDRTYAPWLEALARHTYRCTCTRAALAAFGGRYPGTCRDAGNTEGSLRFRLPDGRIRVVDRRRGVRHVDPRRFGDPVLRRRDGVYAYTLAVVADDIADGVTEVVRGADLLHYTGVQIRLWEAFGATPPTWLHAPVLLGPDGHKLSKSLRSATIGALREAGLTPDDVWRRVFPWLGIPAQSLGDAVPWFRAEAVPLGPINEADGPPPTP